jgi:hypothetical protein
MGRPRGWATVPRHGCAAAADGCAGDELFDAKTGEDVCNDVRRFSEPLLSSSEISYNGMTATLALLDWPSSTGQLG